MIIIGKYFVVGLGIVMLIMLGFISIYYNVLIMWLVLYFFFFFMSDFFWSNCDNKWNIKGEYFFIFLRE